jgi:hypothetical protein
MVYEQIPKFFSVCLDQQQFLATSNNPELELELPKEIASLKKLLLSHNPLSLRRHREE